MSTLLVNPLPCWPEGLVRDAEFSLIWLAEKGYGYLNVTEAPYDEAYFEKYRGYAKTAMGRAITAERVALVDRHCGLEDTLIDVGIGCGDFLSATSMPHAYGCDINPAGIAWLEERGLVADPYGSEVDALTFWDSLEHIPDVARMIANARQYVFCSLPIFTGPDHVLRSVHFRRTEHCWYFTRDGLIAWMADQGFRCVEHGTPESLLGRVDVHTFAFRRVL